MSESPSVYTEIPDSYSISILSYLQAGGVKFRPNWTRLLHHKKYYWTFQMPVCKI